jgi:syntaxin 1B/2/3
VLSQQDFLGRVDFAKSEIRTLSSNIQEIASLHQRALSSPDSSSSAQLENLVTQTQLKNTQIRDQIKYLELDAVKTQDGTKSVKARQAKQLKGEFEKSLKEYQQEEVAYRQRYRDQIARQYRIVNPEATESEVQEASELDWGSEGVFQTALKSNRSGQASSVLGAVRARHNELQRIEATLTELAAMFADMAQIVEAQDPVVEHTEQNAIKTAEDVDKGNTEIDKANEHARRRNRLKWWCLLVVVLIVLAIALGVGLGVGLATKH